MTAAALSALALLSSGVLAKGDGDLIIFLIWGGIFVIGLIYNGVMKVKKALEGSGDAPRQYEPPPSRPQPSRRPHWKAQDEDDEDEDDEAEYEQLNPPRGDAYAEHGEVLTPPPVAAYEGEVRIFPVAAPRYASSDAAELVQAAPAARAPQAEPAAAAQRTGALLPPEIAGRLSEAQRAMVLMEVIGRSKRFAPRSAAPPKGPAPKPPARPTKKG